MNAFTKASALQMDHEDPLGGLRAAFSIQNPSLIYLDGNSLGMLVKEAAGDLSRAVEESWGDGLIRSWNEGWYDRSRHLGDKIAAIAGASPGEVVVADSTSVNLYKLAYAALKMQKGRKKIITDDLNFPSDLYVLQGLIEAFGAGYELVVIESGDGMTIDTEAVRAAIDEETALVSFSHVVFKSAFMYPMEEVTAAAHQKGAMVLWDLSHSIGAVPVELNKSGADLAVGCTYKYLNGGPGAPAFLYVREELQEKLQSPVWGWFGEKDPFEFGHVYRPARGIRKFLAGTPPILSMVPVERTLDMMIDCGMNRLREKSVRQTDYFIGLADHFLAPHGFTIGSPREEARRGSHVSIRHPEAYRICRSLIDPAKGKYQVIPDFREPDNIRIGITPLYTRYTDLFHAVKEMEETVRERYYLGYTEEKDAVT